MTGPRPARRPRSVPAPSTAALEERIADLEARLLSMESHRPSMEGAGHLVGMIIPAEATRHFRAAGREQLLGMRALVDHWIRRLEKETHAPERETIPIE